jgi:hypothetical protein
MENPISVSWKEFLEGIDIRSTQKCDGMKDYSECPYGSAVLNYNMEIKSLESKSKEI